MRLVQLIDSGGARAVAVAEDDSLRIVDGAGRIYDLALEAAESGEPLAALAAARAGSTVESYDRALAEERVLPPIDHPDPAHCLVTGTGLSHLGSAQARDDMHARLESGESLTDSMRMFRDGLERGKPADGEIGALPEWFWKGDGAVVVGCGAPLERPGHALDGGEEAEIAGIYVVDREGRPRRLGFALANEFSDHVLERRNYLLLAHSKLRPCALGPELRLGPLPAAVSGAVRVLRGGEALWTGEFLSGEDNMSHSVANLEHHHFKYERFRRPGDAHVHFLGAGVLSHAAGIAAADGDMFEIDVPAFGRPLRNPLRAHSGEQRVSVLPL